MVIKIDFLRSWTHRGVFTHPLKARRRLSLVSTSHMVDLSYHAYGSLDPRLKKLPIKASSEFSSRAVAMTIRYDQDEWITLFARSYVR